MPNYSPERVFQVKRCLPD